MARSLSLVAAILAAFATAHPASAQQTMTPPDSAEESDARGGIQIEAEALLANVYESNIDHSRDGVASMGFVPAFHIRLSDRPEKARLIADYTLAQHRYTNTDRWNRTSHLARVGYEAEPATDLASVTEVEISYRGSSEDRDLANQYQLRQTFELELADAHRAEVYTTLRYKTVPEEPDGNAFKPNVGLAYQHRWARGGRLELGVRWETNREQVARGDYNRRSFGAEFRLPVSTRGDRVELGLRQRLKTYSTRRAEDANGDETRALRRDRQWTIDAVWHRPLLSRADLEVGVEVESRTSNDPDKPYTAAALVLGLRYRF